jgi:hypothetical protein
MSGTQRLGTQVTIRLEPAVAEQLRQVARRMGEQYTALLRGWIVERLHIETSRSIPQPPDIQVAGSTPPPRIQITGAGRLVR